MTIVPEDHGTQVFPVENGYLRDFGFTELSMNDLRRLRDEEWARVKASDESHAEFARASSLFSALNHEIYYRRNGFYDKSHIDSSDLDKTYIYPGDPAPPGKKWVLVDDDSEGIIAYVDYNEHPPLT